MTDFETLKTHSERLGKQIKELGEKLEVGNRDIERFIGAKQILDHLINEELNNKQIEKQKEVEAEVKDATNENTDSVKDS